MRADGLCTKCGKQNPTPEKSMCPECSIRQSELRKRNREYREKIGVCTKCGKNKAEPHKKFCYECLGREQDRYFQSKRTDKEREIDRIRKQKLADERKNNGLCIRCGKKNASATDLCGRCKGYLKVYRNRHRKDIMRSERPNYGICYICGKNPIDDGKKVCNSCYETRLDTLPMMFANRNNEYFKQLNTARYAEMKVKYKRQ